MIDSYGRQINYLRLSITDRCNLRCRYCMPEDGICKKSREELMTEDEMIRAVEVAASLGITKLRITGGEPLVKRNVLSICQQAAAVKGIDEVCMTTNGILLPSFARSLKDAGVKRINLSLDTLDPVKYAHMTRCGSLHDALAGLDAALEVGFEKVKINAVLIGGFNDDEIPALADVTMKYPVDVRFIELMPMRHSSDFGHSAFIPCTKVLEQLPEANIQADGDGVAKLYRIPGALGNIGLISPLSDHFCGSCNRIRVTADGKLKPCLHSADEFSIKGMDQSERERQFRMAIQAKPACHPYLSPTSRSQAGRNMNQIGG